MPLQKDWVQLSKPTPELGYFLTVCLLPNSRVWNIAEGGITRVEASHEGTNFQAETLDKN